MANDVKFVLSAEDRTRAAFRQVEGGLKGLTATALRLSTGLAALSGVTIGGALASLAANATRTAGELADMSARTKLSVRDLSELKFAAEQSDTSLDTLVGGVTRLSQLLFDAQAGKAEARGLVSALGLDPDSLNNGKDALLALADRVAAIENPLERAAVAAKVLGGSAGPEMVAFLAQGSEGIRELFTEAENAGAIIDEKFAKAVDAANDNLSALAGTLQGSITVALGNSAGKFERITRAMRDAASDGASLARVLQIGLAGVLAETFSDANLEGAERLRKELEQQKDTLKELQDIQNREPRRTTGLDRLKDSAGIGLQDQLAATRARVDELQRLLDVEIQAEEEAAKKEAQIQQEKVKNKKKVAAEMRRIKEEEAAALAEEKRVIQEANREVSKLADERAKVGEKFKNLVADVRAGPTSAVDDLTDVSAINFQARQAIQQGDPETAIRLAERAGEALKKLQEDGKEGTLVAGGMAAQIQKIAEEAAKLQEQQGLQKIAPKFDVDATLQDVDALRTAILDRLKDLEVTIKLKADTSGLPAGAQPAAGESEPESFARGGWTGPGARFRPAGIVHADEYVFSNPAVRTLGVGFLDMLHSLARVGVRPDVLGRLPGYAEGGLVGRIGPSAPTNHFTFNLPDGSKVSTTDAPEDIRRVIERAALKLGGRR